MQSFPSLIIFDIGGVVVFGWQTVGRIARKYGLDPDELRADYERSDGPLMEGTLSTKDWWLHVCAKFGLDAEARRHDPMDEEFHCTSDPRMLDLLRQLKGKGVRIVCGSNTCAPHWKKMEASGNLAALFDHCYLSQELHIEKPDPQFFRYICAHEGVEPSQVLFVDDTKVNVDAALKTGLQGHWYHTDWVWNAIDRLRFELGLPFVGDEIRN